MTKPTRGSFNATMLAFIVVVGGARVAADAQGWIHKDSASATSAAGKERNNAGAAIISPRMDFEQWTPLGRGDPLKNDPTFDYMPPAVDKVHYWKTSTGSTAVNRVRPPASSSAAPAALYNRRFFLTDFSRKELPQLVPAYAPYKRPVAATALPQQAVVTPVRSGYLPPPRPKTPLPMLTPPPYRWPAAGAVTTVLPVDVPTLVQLLQQQHHQQQQQQHAEVGVGDSAAESKRPPDVRAPPPSAHSAAVIKTLLDAEVDRTTVTTPGPEETTMDVGSSTPPPPPFAHYRRPSPLAAATAAVTDTPSPPPPPQMYLIIQGHSRVRKYGLHATKSDALELSASAQDHNHVGHDGPDRGEPSRRRKRDLQQWLPEAAAAAALWRRNEIGKRR